MLVAANKKSLLFLPKLSEMGISYKHSFLINCTTRSLEIVSLNQDVEWHRNLVWADQ
jgi:hypothetical protein